MTSLTRRRTRFGRLGRELLFGLSLFFRRLYIRYLAWRLPNHPELMKAVLEDAAKAALRRVTLEGLCPPDTVSMGVCNGGPAIFFKHDAAQEVFIGKNYEDAADHFLKWLREMRGMGEGYAPTTASTTKLSRHDRRAYASKKFRNKHKPNNRPGRSR